MCKTIAWNMFNIEDTNKNCTLAENKNILHSGNACYRSAQSLFPSSVLCKDINIKIHRTIIFLIVFVAYGCETWCLTLREEHTAEGVRE